MKEDKPELPMLLQFDYDLKFDEGEVGGTGTWSYWSLVTDYQSPAEILIRIDGRYGLDGEEASMLAEEVVKRWNAYNARAPEVDVEAIRRSCKSLSWGEPFPKPAQIVDRIIDHLTQKGLLRGRG